MKPRPEFPILQPELSAYDWQQDADDAAASRQIEHDQQQSGHVPEPVELPDDYFETEPF